MLTNFFFVCRRPNPQLSITFCTLCSVLQVSVDGASFTTDCTRFQYYPTPQVVQVTPDTCRPPFPTLRLDGEHLIPRETFLVRFEEEQVETTEGANAGGEEGSFLVDEKNLFEGTSEEKVPPPSGLPLRVFTVPGRVESELIEVGTDPDTELPIQEERWFLTCESPPLPPEAKVPFISRLTVAPNGINFTGEPLRFVAHDPHADLCVPPAVPIPVTPPPIGGDDDKDSVEGRAETKGPCIRITGRNLYRGTELAIRLRFGLEEESVVPFHEVSFNPASESIVGFVPVEAGQLIARAGGAAQKEPQALPAISVVVEVAVDGREYFAVPERLTLFHGPHLTLQGDGLYPVAGGGWAELKTKELTFRGHEAKVSRQESCCHLVRGGHGACVAGRNSTYLTNVESPVASHATAVFPAMFDFHCPDALNRWNARSAWSPISTV